MKNILTDNEIHLNLAKQCNRITLNRFNLPTAKFNYTIVEWRFS